VPQNQVWRHLNAKLFQPERALDVVWHLFNELAGLFKDLIIKRSGHSALIPPILRNGRSHLRDFCRDCNGLSVKEHHRGSCEPSHLSGVVFLSRA
jgi:hypothetical protein